MRVTVRHFGGTLCEAFVDEVNTGTLDKEGSKALAEHLREVAEEISPAPESEDSAFLAALQGCGVDNWCGYDDAVGMLELGDEL